MRRFVILCGLLAALCLAAFVTKPSTQATEAHLTTVLRERVIAGDISTQADVLGAAAMIGCKLRPQDCADLLRRGIDMQIADRTLYTRIDVSGFGEDARCYGLFGRFWCPWSDGVTGSAG